MAVSALGARCYSVVHVEGDILGADGNNEYYIYMKQVVAIFLLPGTRLAFSSPVLLIKPYQLLGEKYV